MTERPHVVFVDDEAQLLTGLRRALRDKREAWDMSFATGAEQALEVLATKPCAVLVSDYRMPGMDGGQLLRVVRDQYPDTSRMILSGHTDKADLAEAIELAHHFMNKPCATDELVEAVHRLLET
jgi:DNA-binding NtrC family response regulator